MSFCMDMPGCNGLPVTVNGMLEKATTCTVLKALSYYGSLSGNYRHVKTESLIFGRIFDSTCVYYKEAALVV